MLEILICKLKTTKNGMFLSEYTQTYTQHILILILMQLPAITFSKIVENGPITFAASPMLRDLQASASCLTQLLLLQPFLGSEQVGAQSLLLTVSFK